MSKTFLVVALGLVACGGGTPREEALCNAPVTYRGPALHAPPKPEDFPATTIEPTTPLPAEAAIRLRAAFDDAASKMPIAGMTAAIATADGHYWTTTTPAPPSRYWWASVGKAFTAVVILQLVAEGKLALTTPLSTFAPRVPNASAITIAHLLDHTSGVYSFQEDAELRARTGYIPPEQLVDVAVKHGPQFCPGLAWSYSNTGYVLLGQVIEAIEKQPYHEVVNRRLFAAASPPDVEAFAPNVPPADLALPKPNEDPTNTHHDLTTPYAAGAVVGTSLGLVRAWRSLLAPRSFDVLYPMFDSPTMFYGRGVMLYDLAKAGGPDTDVWLGHSGGNAGAKAVVFWSTQRRAFVAVALTGEGSPESTALLLLKAL